jgi:hypothetical protein
MSRLVRREVILGNEAVILGSDEKPKVNDKVEETQQEKNNALDIPDKELFGYDLKKIKGYREKRAQLKDEANKKEFVEAVQKMLEVVASDESLYDYDILKNIIIMAEHHFIEHKKCGELKKSAVIESTIDLLFEGNRKVAEKMIELKIKEIWQSNVVTKNKTKISRLFFSLLEKCL